MKKKALSLLSVLAVTCTLSSCLFIRHPNIFISRNDNSSHAPSGKDIAYKTPNYTSEYSTDNRTLDNIGIGRGYRYLPSSGNRKILVVPIDTTDHEFTSKQVQNIKTAFFGTSEENGWESVASFYEKSSYGKLHITGDVTPVVHTNKTSSELSATAKTYLNNNKQWTDYLLEDILSTLVQNGYDLSEYDTNDDGYLDAIWMVYSVPYDQSSDLYWAYTTWVDDTSANKFSGKKACLYSWASYGFINQNYGFNDFRNPYVDSHTYIHETGHRLGLDDYYSYDYRKKNSDGSTNYDTPIGGLDRMDRNILDHDVFSKYLLGWNKPRVVTKDYLSANNNKLTLNAYQNNGDALLIPIYKDGSRDYNGTPFDEYLLLEYYTPTNLNHMDATTQYYTAPRGFSQNGVLCFHVDARIGKLIPNKDGSPIWNEEVYDKIQKPNSDWGRRYLYTFLYSNTFSYSYDQSRDDSSLHYYRGRLISLRPANGQRINGRAVRVGNTIKYDYADNSSLFTSINKSFEANYSDFAFDDRTKASYSFQVVSTSTSSCNIEFTEL